MMTPFSGISLIAHLLVIAIAKLVHAFSYSTPAPVRRPARPLSVFQRLAGVVASVAVIAVIFSIMSSAFVVALKTGVKEGSREPQVIFVKKQLVELKNWLQNDFVDGVALLN